MVLRPAHAPLRPLRAGLICSLLVPTLLQVAAAAPQAREGSALAPTVDEAAEAPSAALFLDIAAKRLGADPAEVQLQHLEGPLRLLETGLTLYVRAALHGEERAVVALDPRGFEHDLELALARERQVAEALHGKRTRRLDEALLEAGGEPVDVMVWLEAPDTDPIRAAHAELSAELDRFGELDRDAAEAQGDQLERQVSDVIAPVTEAFADDARAEGLVVLAADRLVPVVFLRADAAQLAALEQDARVLSIDDANGTFTERMNVARAEVRADVVHTSWGGNRGAGVRVGVVEGGRVCTGNGNLSVSGARQSGPTTDHVTGVASCIKSTHPLHQGIAPDAILYSANGAGNLSSSSEAINWAIGRGCRILNLSYGAATPGATVSAFDRYLDSVVRNAACTITIACGNSGDYAGDPGAGYNAIAVGNFNDRGASAWSGEFMSATSSWRNPTTGVETPQVAAPGSVITMLDCAGGAGYTRSGTSFSAPIVAGCAALMMNDQPVLGMWPEAVRAILMATAWHNIEGASTLSSRDGAGGVDARAAWRVASRGVAGYRYGVLQYGSFSGSWYHAQTSFASAGQRVRCVVSWDSAPEGGAGYDVNQLKADFDLFVYGPDGAFVAAAGTVLQPFEVVEFTAPRSGNYQLRLRRRRFSGAYEYFGTAMTISSDQ